MPPVLPLLAALTCAAAETVVFQHEERGLRVVAVERRAPGLAYHELTATSPSDDLRVTRLTVHPRENVAPESAGPWLDGRPMFSDLPGGAARLFVLAADPAKPFSWTLELGLRNRLRRNDVFDSHEVRSGPAPETPEYGGGRFEPTELDLRLAGIKERRLAEAAAEDARTLPDRIERALKVLADASDHRAAVDEEEAEARAAEKEELRARAQAREARRHSLVRGTLDAMETVRRSAEAGSKAAQLSIRDMASRSAAPPGGGRPKAPPGRPPSAPPAAPPGEDAKPVVAAGASCDPKLAGRYERPNKGGGRYGWYFVFGADCRGEFCAETLTDWEDGGSPYAYHCGRARELAEGKGLQKFDWAYDPATDSVTLSGGKNETYKVHRDGNGISIYTAVKVR